MFKDTPTPPPPPKKKKKKKKLWMTYIMFLDIKHSILFMVCAYVREENPRSLASG